MTQNSKSYGLNNGGHTRFSVKGKRGWPEILGGLPCGGRDCFDSGGFISLLVSSTDGTLKLPLVAAEPRATFAPDRVQIKTDTLAETLQVQSDWTFCADTGIWRRRDTIKNKGTIPLIIHRFLSGFPLVNTAFEAYTQTGGWCRENQGKWQNIGSAGLCRAGQGGRTTRDASPCLFLRETTSKRGLAFHLFPQGNWVMRIQNSVPEGTAPECLNIELGPADTALAIRLEPGAEWTGPEILIQPFQGDAHEAAVTLHRYLLRHFFPAVKPAPIVYNTWFDDFEFLQVSRLQKQLAAAREIGCEIFVVDAGWYGGEPGKNWSQQTGDWREKTDAAFHGKMKAFADEVRQAGLRFGLWMEPERFCAGVPELTAHADRFRQGANGCWYPDFSLKAVQHSVRQEIARLIETYNLAWIKIDFNFDLGTDPSGAEFHRYYQEYYQILDTLRARYPQVFFEGCASGGMRLDLHTLTHFDGHFLSDNVNPWDVLRILQGALLRLPPGRLIKWAVLRSAGRDVPKYGTPLAETKERLLVPAGCGAIWDQAEIADLDFAVRVALPGMFGLSGDLAGLPEPKRKRLTEHLAFAREWRDFFLASRAHLLTPPRPIGDRSGWVAFQFQAETDDILVFAYRLNDPQAIRQFPLRDLIPEKMYTIRNADQPDAAPISCRGSELMRDGLTVSLTVRHRAGVYQLH